MTFASTPDTLLSAPNGHGHAGDGIAPGSALPRDPQWQALLAFALAQSPAIFYIGDLAGDLPLRFISPNVETITGHKVTCFVEQSDFHFRHIHPEDLDRYKHNLVALRCSRTLTHEYRLATADGTYRWFRDDLRCVEGPRPAGHYVGSMIDITGEKQSELSWRESDELLRRVLEACPLPILMSRVEDGAILYESPASRRAFGVYRQASNRPILERYRNPQDRLDYLAALRSRGALDNYEVEFRRADGSVFVGSVSARLIRNCGTDVIVASTVDLTGHRRRETDLRHARETLEDAIEALEEGIVLYDANDRLVMCNAQYKSFHGDCQDLLAPGAHWPDVTRARAERGFFSAAEDRTGPWVDEQIARRGWVGSEEFQRKDGRRFEYSQRATRQGGFVSVWRDVTERREAEAKLARQREWLHQSEKLGALGELLAGVSHELNNPLSVLVGQALMLKQHAKDAATAARAERIGKAADRCARIVKTFLAMARDDPDDIAPVNLNSLVETALEVTAYSLRTSSIDLSLRLAGDLPAVMADGDQMRQVFLNLIVNADHALQERDGPRKLSITTSFHKKTGSVTIRFKDNGSGVPEDIRGRIFEPLFTTREPGSGTGLGLALCHRIVEAHGGTIELERTAGTGAAFVIRMPRHVDETAGQKTRAAAAGRDSLRILVIDDEPEVGEVISEILEHDGHRVDVVEAAEAGLELIKRNDFDIVLSDVRMPGMDGVGLYRALSEIKPEQIQGLAFITGDALSRRVRDFLDASERPYLEKPITPRDAREVLDLLMRRRRPR